MKPNHSFAWPIGGRWSTYTSNAQGARANSDFSNTCGGPRIVLVGDSYFFGNGLSQEETVGAQLFDSLARSVAVYDLSMPGFGLDQIWMSLRHKAFSLCPTLVVAGFIDDDWQRSLTAYRLPEGMTKPIFLLDGDSLRQQTAADRPGAVGRLIDRSASVQLIRLASRKLAYRFGGGGWWRLNTAILKSMARDAAAAHTPILFIRIPVRDANRSFPALRRQMQQMAANYLDLAEPSTVPSGIYLEGGVHLNARGSAFVAGAILSWIRANGPQAIVKR
jgi:hypothetical protein